MWAKEELLWKELIEADLTVGLVVLLSEDAFRQLSQAESAHEVFRMKLMPHGTDAAASDGLPTATTEGPSALMVMEFAERMAIQFKEGARRKTTEAVPTDKALWVPDSVHGWKVVFQHWAVAATTLGWKHG